MKYDITPACRVAEIKEYYFSRKLREIAERNAAGEGIISLGIGGPDKPPHPLVAETLCEETYLPENHSYQPYTGLPQLRQAYAAWYFRHYKVALNPDTEILPLIGSKEGIMHISLAFLNPGDGVLVPNPGYPTYTSASRIVGARIVNYDLKEDNGWYPDFETLENADLTGVKLMWVNYPNMPTGAPATMELFERLVDFGRRHNIVIVNDNPYSFILNDRPLSILAVEGAKDIAIELNSLSKSHNMAGWRMGVMLANPQFTEWVIKVKSNIDSGQFKPMMKAAVKALELPALWYRDLNHMYQRRRAIAEEIMTALGCTFDPGQRGLFLWGRLPEGETSSEKFCDRILDKAKVFVTPGFIFGSGGEGYLRISLCATTARLREALRRIKKASGKN